MTGERRHIYLGSGVFASWASAWVVAWPCRMLLNHGGLGGGVAFVLCGCGALSSACSSTTRQVMLVDCSWLGRGS